MSLGERISELRKAQNMSQVQLAEALEVSRQAVSKWENDLATPDPKKIILLAEVLDSDIEYLSTGRKKMSRRPPVVLKTVETVETVVEKPVVRIVEKVVEKPVVEYVEKPVIKKIYRTKYVRNSVEFLLLGIVCFVAGILVGFLISI